MGAALGATGNVKARIGGRWGAPALSRARAFPHAPPGSRARRCRPRRAGSDRPPASRCRRAAASRACLRRGSGATASAAGRAARSARNFNVALCICPKAKPDQRAAGLQSRTRRRHGRRGLRIARERIRKLGATPDMSRHAPSPVVRAAGCHEPCCERQRDIDGLSLRDRATLLRAVSAHDQTASRAALDADIGGRLRQRTLRRRNRRQSRILPAGREAFWPAPLQARPPAAACRRLRVQNGATRMLRWISVSTSASIRPSCASPAINGSWLSARTPRI